MGEGVWRQDFKADASSQVSLRLLQDDSFCLKTPPGRIRLQAHWCEWWQDSVSSWPYWLIGAPMGTATMETCSFRISKKNQRENRAWPSKFLEVTSITFALFFRSKSLGLIYNQGEEIVQNVWIPGGSSLWEPCWRLPTTPDMGNSL